MLDIKVIRENPEKVNELLKRRNPDLSIDEIIEIDAERRKIQIQTLSVYNCEMVFNLFKPQLLHL